MKLRKPQRGNRQLHRESVLLPLTTLSVLAAIVTAQTQAHAALDCSDSITIPTLQGSSHVSPFADQDIQTCGVVTAVGFNFYYIQDSEGDGNSATSDALFVFDSSGQPPLGSEVKLSGTLSEFIPGGAASGNLSVTQLAFPDILEQSTPDALPEPVVLGLTGRLPPAEVVISESELSSPINLQNAEDAATTPFNPDVDAIDFYESLEGMLVTIPDAVAVSAIRQFGNFSAELFSLADNGAGASPADARSVNGGILLQPDPDNRGDQNPERLQVQFDGTVYQGDEFPYVQVGDKLGTVTGVVGYSFGNFEVLAIDALEITDGGVRPEIAPTSDGSALTVASYNVLNLSAVEADDDQREKIASQIVTQLHSPDIIALQEIQDNNGDIGNCSNDDPSPCAGVLDASETLQELADSISEAGGPDYEWFTVDPLIETTDDNRDDPDAFGGASLSNIRNAFLYNATRVQLTEFTGLTREELQSRGVQANTAFDASRDPLEARFTYQDESIIILNNHFESRFGSTPIFGGPQPFVQAAEDAREAQALAMHELVSAYLEEDSESNIMVLGDLNTFEFTNDLAQILPSASGSTLLTRLADETSAADEYSFIFDGNSQALDHVFVSSALNNISTLNYVHVNVDFPRRSTDIVASDHEPLLTVIDFANLPGGSSEVLNLNGAVYSSTALELFWDRQESPDASYRVTRDGTVEETVDGTSLFVQDLSPDTTYQFTLEWLGDGEQVIATESISLKTNAAFNGTDAPEDSLVQQLSGTVYSSSALELFWIIEEPPANLSFNIMRDDNLIATTDGRSYFDSQLSVDTSYAYRVEPVVNGVAIDNGLTVSLRTNTENGTTLPEDAIDLSGSVYSASAIELFWSRAQASAVSAYRIARNGNILDTRDATSFFEEGLMANTTYVYEVTPVDAQGVAQGNTVSIEVTTLN